MKPARGTCRCGEELTTDDTHVCTVVQLERRLRDVEATLKNSEANRRAASKGELESLRLQMEAEGERDGALARLAQMREAWEYFACPRCQCAWFRLFGPYENDELECKHCGWHGLRKEGESERFFSFALAASAQEQKSAKEKS